MKLQSSRVETRYLPSIGIIVLFTCSVSLPVIESINYSVMGTNQSVFVRQALFNFPKCWSSIIWIELNSEKKLIELSSDVTFKKFDYVNFNLSLELPLLQLLPLLPLLLDVFFEARQKYANNFWYRQLAFGFRPWFSWFHPTAWLKVAIVSELWVNKLSFKRTRSSTSFI